MHWIWHVVAALINWLHANLQQIGISSAITSIGLVIMWALGFRKARLENTRLVLEIERIRSDTKRIELEVQKLAEEKRQRESAKAVADLGERIVELAKEYVRTHPNTAAASFSEEHLCSALAESQETIGRALSALMTQGIARYVGQFQSWIIKP